MEAIGWSLGVLLGVIGIWKGVGMNRNWPLTITQETISAALTLGGVVAIWMCGGMLACTIFGYPST